MIRSLPEQNGDVSRDCDVHVIGAGIAGLLIATRLAKHGRRVIVTESGGARQLEDSHPLNAVVHLRSVYGAAETGRARCLGGTSTRWGGAMIPFQPADLREGSGWPVAYEELLRYLPDVEALFGLPAGPYDEPDLARPADGARATHIARLAKWPAFPRRNVAVLLDSEIRAASGPEVWLEATATEFAFAPDGRVESVTARAPNGRGLTITARETVIAAGAIESTRLLLLADHQNGGRMFAPDDVLGRYFHDHLSACVATIETGDRMSLNRVAGFRFQGSAMRNLRFELSDAEDIRRAVPAGFAHIAFAAREGSGFDALRNIFRLLQQRRMPGIPMFMSLARELPWFARAVWWRMIEHRLLYPADADIELHMVTEQQPRAENRILLSRDRRDRHEQPLAAIDWGVSDADIAALGRATDLFIAFWERSNLARLGVIRRKPAGEAEAVMARSDGVFHPGGSTRMGRTPSDGVLDSGLRTFRVPNLSVAATSAFPTGGGANPTMMLMMASLRLADRLAAAR